MAARKGFWRRRAAVTSGEIEPIRVGDVLPAAPGENAQQVAGRVQSIIAAAQENAAEIERFAHADAERIRAEAIAEGEAHLERVRASTAAIEQRAAAMEEAIAEIVGGLGRGAAQLDRELADISSTIAELEAPAEPAPQDEPEVSEPAAEAPTDDAASSSGEPDNEGARLVALDMALEGRDRDEAGAELAEHYPGVDIGKVLDEVYAEFGPAEPDQTPADPDS